MATNIDIRNFVNIAMFIKEQVVQSSSPGSNTFTIILNYNSEGGNVTASSLKGEVGEKVTLTITPSGDYQIYSVKINGLSQSPSESITFTPKTGSNRVSVVFATEGTEKLAAPVIRLEQID